MIRPKTNRITSTVALACAGLAAIFGCLSFVAGPDIPLLAKSERSSAVVDSLRDSSAANSSGGRSVEARRPIGFPVPIEREPAPPTRKWALSDIDTSGESRVRVAAEVAGQDISQLPVVVEKMRDAREVDRVVVASVSYAARRNAAATFAAARGLKQDERNHAQALVGHEFLRRGDLQSAISVMKSLQPDISRTMLIWNVSEKYASQDIAGAARWVMDSFPKGSPDREDAFGAIVAARFGSRSAADLRQILPYIENKTDRTNAVDAVTRGLAAMGQSAALDGFAESLLPDEAAIARKIYRKVGSGIR